MSNISDFFTTFATQYPEARCLDHAEEMFPLSDSNGEGKKYCVQCPHKMTCLTEAIETDSYGIWGETTRNERKEIILSVKKLLDWESEL